MIDLFNADCLDAIKLIDDNTVNLTITSPPYDNLRTYEGSLKWNESVWQKVIQELYSATKPGGVVVWVVGDATIKGSETGTSFKQALYFKEVGFNIHDTMIWLKPNPIPRNHNRYEQAFEYMFVFSKGKPNTFHPIRIPCKNAGKPNTGNMQQDASGKRLPKHKKGLIKKDKIKPNVWEMTNNSNRTLHPAVFPEQLVNDHILTWSNKGDIVLDPFMGSGTTGKIAVELDRDFIGFEIVDKYFEIAESLINEKVQNVSE